MIDDYEEDEDTWKNDKDEREKEYWASQFFPWELR